MHARTWSEELVSEWLFVKGYFIAVDVPIASRPRGGRSDADVIGIKPINNAIELLHCEIMHGAQSYNELLSNIKKKFSAEVINQIKTKYLGSCTNCDIIYKKCVIIDESISLNAVRRLREDLRENDIEVKHIQDFFQEVISLVRDYATRHRTLPDSCWLLNMLRSLMETKLL